MLVSPGRFRTEAFCYAIPSGELDTVRRQGLEAYRFFGKIYFIPETFEKTGCCNKLKTND
jgi:hypothetical protein